MKLENAIEVNNIKKKFKIFFDKGRSLKEKLLFQSRNRYEDRWVLNGISFHVKRGEAIGLIGKNGCGKSTTLKILSRIMYPTEGTVEIKGRVSSLLELGAGFHPDMSGRENIYTNASIFGLSKKEIDTRLDDIIAFSELEEFIDNPVRTYSSGMYMRLAFSVAINVDAEVLLIDEILAVGDVSFQAKCFEKLKEIKKRGTTIVIVSHSLSEIEKICERSIWIDEGIIKEEGIPKLVHDKYLAAMEQKRMEKMEEHQTVPTNLSAARSGNKNVEIINVEILNENGTSSKSFHTAEYINAVIHVKSNVGKEKINIGIGIYRDDLLYCFGSNYFIEKNTLISECEEGILNIKIKNDLMPGNYHFDIWIHDELANDLDSLKQVNEFQVFSTKGDFGTFRMNTEWSFTKVSGGM